MPTVHIGGLSIPCEQGAKLLRVLVDARVSPHRGVDKILNCHGMGLCGKCAMEVHGEPSFATLFERVRLWLRGRRGLRLACQVRVIGDVYVNAGRLRDAARSPHDRSHHSSTRPVRSTAGRSPSG